MTSMIQPVKLVGRKHRGELPQEHDYAATLKGEPDDATAMRLADVGAAVAYMLGFDTDISARIVSGRRVPGSYVLRITEPDHG